MFSANQLIALLSIFFLLLLGLWGGKKIFAYLRRPDNQESDSVSQDVVEKQLDIDESKLLRTYFRGLSYVLANETDKAVAEFVKVAQVDSTTAEIYLALGQLFRNSGEVERAIRVHRDILLRPILPDDVRQQTFFEIGLDYKKAGFFDRACCAFEEIIERNPKDQAARRELSSLYVNMREWEKALALYHNFPKSQDKASIIAHLTTEVAKTAERSDDKKKALTLFKRAIELDERCVDAWLHYGDFLITENHQQEALTAWEKAFLINPEFTGQVIDRFEKVPETEKERVIESFFLRHIEKYGEERKFNLAYIKWQIESGRLREAELLLRKVLTKTGGDRETFYLAGQLLKATSPSASCDRETYDLLVDDIFTAKFRFEKKYHCQKCGYKLDQMVWRCPRCSNWDSVNVL